MSRSTPLSYIFLRVQNFLDSSTNELVATALIFVLTVFTCSPDTTHCCSLFCFFSGQDRPLPLKSPLTKHQSWFSGHLSFYSHHDHTKKLPATHRPSALRPSGSINSCRDNDSTVRLRSCTRRKVSPPPPTLRLPQNNIANRRA